METLGSTIAVVISILLCGLAIVGAIRSQFDLFTKELTSFGKVIEGLSSDIRSIFAKLELKQDKLQCQVDRDHCPCGNEIANVKQSHNSLKQKVGHLEDKHNELEKSVAIHHSQYKNLIIQDE